MAAKKSVGGIHVDLKMIENYLRGTKFLEDITGKGNQEKFRWAGKIFSLLNGQTIYKFNSGDEKVRKDIFHDVHNWATMSMKVFCHGI